MRLFGKIGRRLLGWFLLVALIPLLFMGYQGYFFARRAVEREVMRHMETIAKSKQLAIEQWFREQQHDLDILAADPLFSSHPVDTVAVKALLQSVQIHSSQFAVLSYWADNYAINFPNGAAYANEDAWSQPQIDTVAYRVSVIYLNSLYGPAVDLTRKLRGSSNHYAGQLFAIVRLSNSLDPIILDTTGLGRTGQAYLVDEKKVMLTPSRFMNHPKPLSHTMDSEGIRNALAGGSGAGVYEGFEGQPVLGAWTYMPQQQWALIAEMNADEAFAPLAALRRDAIIVALITMSAILIVVALISRSISMPIRRLAEASLDVSQGNLDRMVVVNLNDELGELAARFNQMVHSLRDSQRQLVQSERLAAIGELVASVVHEIRNPLSAVKMNLRILESKCATDPITIEHFKLAKSQTDRLEEMLSELLDYSKPIALHKQPVNAQDVIADALAHFKTESQDGVHVETHFAENLPSLSADRERLVQVLLNLLLNARQAVNGNGRITIFAEAVADAVRISVEDTGHGISEENLKHVFEPFFTTRKSGTGLGLPNARKIVEAHGGQIRVSSIASEGTSVIVDLPL
jgi:signal transduction histidine kinase